MHDSAPAKYERVPAPFLALPCPVLACAPASPRAPCSPMFSFRLYCCTSAVRLALPRASSHIRVGRT